MGLTGPTDFSDVYLLYSTDLNTMFSTIQNINYIYFNIIYAYILILYKWY